MATRETERILAVLEELAAAYRERDADRYLALFDESALVYGTGADEKCRGACEIRARVERDWAQSDSASFILRDPHVVASDCHAWVAADCLFAFTTGAGHAELTGRATFVLEKSGDVWLVTHAHFSLPSSSSEGSSFPGG